MVREGKGGATSKNCMLNKKVTLKNRTGNFDEYRKKTVFRILFH